MKKIQKIIGIIFQIVLLIIVWQNSHWSVALSLTFIQISFFYMDFALGQMIEDDKNRL